jgi:hypothetical protein
LEAKHQYEFNSFLESQLPEILNHQRSMFENEKAEFLTAI